MLHAHGCRFNTADVRKLARCPRLRTLWYLDLDDTGIGTPAVRELVQGFGKWCPPIMWLTHNRIDDRGAVVLAKWKAATALRVLHLRYNPAMTDAGVRALLDSRHLGTLDGLGVSTADDELNAALRGPLPAPRRLLRLTPRGEIPRTFRFRENYLPARCVRGLGHVERP